MSWRQVDRGSHHELKSDRVDVFMIQPPHTHTLPPHLRLPTADRIVLLCTNPDQQSTDGRFKPDVYIRLGIRMECSNCNILRSEVK